MGENKSIWEGIETQLHLIPELLAVDPFKPLFTEVYRPIIVIFLLISFTPLIRQFDLYRLKRLGHLTYCISLLAGT